MASMAFGLIGSTLAGTTTALSTVGTVLSGVATIGSVLSSMQAAKAEEAAGREQQRVAELNAKVSDANTQAEVANSEAKSAELRREALRRRAKIQTTFAATGQTSGSRQLVKLTGALDASAKRELAKEDHNRRMILTSGALRADEQRLSGSAAVRASRARAGATRQQGWMRGISAFIDMARRG